MQIKGNALTINGTTDKPRRNHRWNLDPANSNSTISNNIPRFYWSQTSIEMAFLHTVSRTGQTRRCTRARTITQNADASTLEIMVSFTWFKRRDHVMTNISWRGWPQSVHITAQLLQIPQKYQVRDKSYPCDRFYICRTPLLYNKLGLYQTWFNFLSPNARCWTGNSAAVVPGAKLVCRLRNHAKKWILIVVVTRKHLRFWSLQPGNFV